ncbi:MAG TPA: hypothetical protein VGN97_16980 [Mesorhizobium sp.]|nr:hypothetical protein [Mesorhizobium sp.]
MNTPYVLCFHHCVWQRRTFVALARVDVGGVLFDLDARWLPSLTEAFAAGITAAEVAAEPEQFDLSPVEAEDEWSEANEARYAAHMDWLRREVRPSGFR